MQKLLNQTPQMHQKILNQVTTFKLKPKASIDSQQCSVLVTQQTGGGGGGGGIGPLGSIMTIETINDGDVEDEVMNFTSRKVSKIAFANAQRVINEHDVNRLA